MNALRKILMIATLGAAIWSLSLVWPELDFVLALAIVLGVTLIIGSIGLALLWRQYFGQNTIHQSRSRHSSHPVAVH